MRMRINSVQGLVVLCTIAWITCGCETRRSQLSERQVDELLSLPAESAAASRELVAADAKSRAALIELHAEVQSELAEIGRRQDALEQDRKAIALQRHREPIVALAIETVGLLIACSLPLIVVALLLWPRPQRQEADLVCDYLIQEVAASNTARLEVNRKAIEAD